MKQMLVCLLGQVMVLVTGIEVYYTNGPVPAMVAMAVLWPVWFVSWCMVAFRP